MAVKGTEAVKGFFTKVGKSIKTNYKAAEKILLDSSAYKGVEKLAVDTFGKNGVVRTHKKEIAVIAGATAGVLLVAAGIKRAVENYKIKKAYKEFVQQMTLMQQELYKEQARWSDINKERLGTKDDFIEHLKARLANS